MQLKSQEVCKLEKSAYGLIDAPYIWFQTLYEELISLGFTSCPFDPCVFTLRHPMTGELCGALGVHVDDGIYYGENEYIFPKSNFQTREEISIRIQKVSKIHCHGN